MVHQVKHTRTSVRGRRFQAGRGFKKARKNPVELPIYQIRGELYFRDIRLGEYRQVNNPSNRIPIDQVRLGDLEVPTKRHPSPNPKIDLSDEEMLGARMALIHASAALEDESQGKDYFLRLSNKFKVKDNPRSRLVLLNPKVDLNQREIATLLTGYVNPSLAEAEKEGEKGKVKAGFLKNVSNKLYGAIKENPRSSDITRLKTTRTEEFDFSGPLPSNFLSRPLKGERIRRL